MLSAEIKINGVLIGHLYLHNRTSMEQLCAYPDAPNTYYVEYCEIGSGTPIKTTVIDDHIRKDGALILIKKAIEALTKEKKKCKLKKKKQSK